MYCPSLATFAASPLSPSATLWTWSHSSVGKPARPHQERGVRIHPVFWTGRQAFDLPLANQRFPSLRLGKALEFANTFHDLH